MDIQYSREAVKHIQAMDGKTKARIREAVENIPAGDIKRLSGHKDAYRLRVGGYRVLFSQNGQSVIIKDVLPRGQAYKR